jgi:hypothetical protein
VSVLIISITSYLSAIASAVVITIAIMIIVTSIITVSMVIIVSMAIIASVVVSSAIVIIGSVIVVRVGIDHCCTHCSYGSTSCKCLFFRCTACQ